MTEIPDHLKAFAGEMPLGPQGPLAPDVPVVGRGRAAVRPFAVHYQGPWETEHDGVQRAVRLHARALGARLPLLLQSFDRKVTDRHGATHDALWGWLEPSVEREVEHLLHTEASALLPRVKHFVSGTTADRLQALLLPRGLSFADSFDDADRTMTALLRNTIAFTVWETTTIDEEVAPLLSRCVQNWVPSTSNQRALVASGVPEDRVFVVPHPFDPASDLIKLQKRPARPAPYEGMVDAERRFYAIGKWEPRKAYDKLFLEFLRTFRPTDSATLLLKTSAGAWRGFWSPEEALMAALADPTVVAQGWTPATLLGRVKVITGYVSPAELLRIHYTQNIFCALSHGEGFGLPAFDAAVAGNRLVVLAGTGPEDFVRAGDVVAGGAPQWAKPEAVHPSYGWGSRQWCGWPQVDGILSEARPPVYGCLQGAREQFSMDRVGALMECLVLKAAPDEVAAAYRSSK